MYEHGYRASHTERQADRNIRPKQLRSREAPCEGSHRSKLMSPRTERPYEVDGTDDLARHKRCPVFSSGDKWSGCAARVHVLTQGGLSPEPVDNGGSGNPPPPSPTVPPRPPPPPPRPREGHHISPPRQHPHAALPPQPTPPPP